MRIPVDPCSRFRLFLPPTVTRWLFYVVFDILYAEGKGAEDACALDEVVRNAVRDTQARQATRTEVKAGNLTVSYG